MHHHSHDDQPCRKLPDHVLRYDSSELLVYVFPWDAFRDLPLHLDGIVTLYRASGRQVETERNNHVLLE